MYDVELKSKLITVEFDYYQRVYHRYNHGIAMEMTDWCKENIGANDWNYYGIYQKRPVMKFRYPEDALAFRIKFFWCQT